MKALMFHHVTFNPVPQSDNQIWLRASEIAEALGYSRADKVTQIYERNADEFAPHMTQITNNSQNLNLRVRVFSLRGCHLLAMFARTAVAKEFRKWVLDILDKEVGQPTYTPAAPLTITLDQQHAIKDAVSRKCCREGRYYQSVYTEFYRTFDIPRYQELPSLRFDEALAWLNKKQSRPRDNSLVESRKEVYSICMHMLMDNSQHIRLLMDLNANFPSTEIINRIKCLKEHNQEVFKFSRENDLRSRCSEPLISDDGYIAFGNGGGLVLGREYFLRFVK